MPAEAAHRLARYAEAWNTRGVRAWGEGWWELPVTVGDQIARLIGAPPGSTVMHQNVTVAEAVVLSCFDLRGERRRIVYEEENFPSVRYLQQAQEARGAEIVVCRDEEEIVAAIDERTLLVPISHVIFKTGRIQDVEPIIERAHEVGAHVVLDAYQSVGSVPLDVTALDVDFAVGGSVKWLCGGPGRGLALRPPRPGRDARADARRLAGARKTVRLRARARVRGRRVALPDRHAERARPLRGDRGLRHRRGDRRRPDPRQLRAADRAAREPARRGRVRGRQPARAGPARRVDRRPCARRPDRARAARGARHHLRLPTRRRLADRAALLQHGRGARARRLGDARDRRSSGRRRVRREPPGRAPRTTIAPRRRAIRTKPS